jgi:hypothetical protein
MQGVLTAGDGYFRMSRVDSQVARHVASIEMEAAPGVVLMPFADWIAYYSHFGTLLLEPLQFQRRSSRSSYWTIPHPERAGNLQMNQRECQSRGEPSRTAQLRFVGCLVRAKRQRQYCANQQAKDVSSSGDSG